MIDGGLGSGQDEIKRGRKRTAQALERFVAWVYHVKVQGSYECRVQKVRVILRNRHADQRETGLQFLQNAASNSRIH